MNNKRYSNVVGKKFHQDGSVRTYPGNTVICMVDPASVVFEKLLYVRKVLENMPWSKSYSFLPPSSYHMTVFRGVNDQVRNDIYWTKLVPIDAPLEQADQVFYEKFRNVRVPKSFSLKYRYLELDEGITVHLLPATDHDAKELKRFRDDVSEHFGVRFPDHDHYKFHITLAYKIFEMNEVEKLQADGYKAQIERFLSEHFGIYESSSPQLMFFNDMFKFSEQRSS